MGFTSSLQLSDLLFRNSRYRFIITFEPLALLFDPAHIVSSFYRIALRLTLLLNIYHMGNNANQFVVAGKPSRHRRRCRDLELILQQRLQDTVLQLRSILILLHTLLIHLALNRLANQLSLTTTLQSYSYLLLYGGCAELADIEFKGKLHSAHDLASNAALVRIHQLFPIKTHVLLVIKHELKYLNTQEFG